MTNLSATADTYPNQDNVIWSRSEKAVARAAFDAALKRELEKVIQQTKQMATQLHEPADLWGLEHYLSERRKEIDRKYDYRYSQLRFVFGRLLYEGWLGEEDLRGLHEGKLKSIRAFTKIIAEMNAA
jgi:hypothetical protein